MLEKFDIVSYKLRLIFFLVNISLSLNNRLETKEEKNKMNRLPSDQIYHSLSIYYHNLPQTLEKYIRRL